MKLRVLALLAIFSVCLPLKAELSNEAWERQHEAACQAVEARYPDTRNAGSKFSIILEYRMHLLMRDNRAALSDPTFIIRLADQVAADLESFGDAVVRTTPDAAGEVQAHIAKKLQEKARQAPRDTTADRLDDLERRQRDMELRRWEQEVANEQRRMQEETDRFMREAEEFQRQP